MVNTVPVIPVSFDKFSLSLQGQGGEKLVHNGMGQNDIPKKILETASSPTEDNKSEQAERRHRATWLSSKKLKPTLRLKTDEPDGKTYEDASGLGDLFVAEPYVP